MMHPEFLPFNPTFHPFWGEINKKSANFRFFAKKIEIIIDLVGKSVYTRPAFTSHPVGRPESSRFCSSVVERILGKDEVAGSNPARSFLISCKNSSSNLIQ